MQDQGNSLIALLEPNGIASVDNRHAIAVSQAAAFAWEEFFFGTIRNAHTRRAYLQAVRAFLAWIKAQGAQPRDITPGMVGRYLDSLVLSAPSKKLHLSAIRSFLDLLVQRHLLVLNPAHSVKAPRYSVLDGKTPEITVEECRSLLASIPCGSVVDYRDRAIIAVLIYTAARAGAVAGLRLGDFARDGIQHVISFCEKGGKARRIPVRFSLQETLNEYIAIARLADASKEEPLFRTVKGRTGRLTKSRITPLDIWRMVRRRLEQAGIETQATTHSFRACSATDLLHQGVPLEDVQHLLGHSDSRVTKLYDRRHRQITRNIVERISV